MAQRAALSLRLRVTLFETIYLFPTHILLPSNRVSRTTQVPLSLHNSIQLLTLPFYLTLICLFPFILPSMIVHILSSRSQEPSFPYSGSIPPQSSIFGEDNHSSMLCYTKELSLHSIVPSVYITVLTHLHSPLVNFLILY